jgi:hypothetical protein
MRRMLVMLPIEVVLNVAQVVDLHSWLAALVVVMALTGSC